MKLLEHLSLKCVVCLKFCKTVLMIWKYVLILFPFFATAVGLTDINLQPNPSFYSPKSDFDEVRAKFRILFDGYRKMFDQSLSKSKYLGDMLRFLPGVVVQKRMSMKGMTALYRTKPYLLERLINSTIMIEQPELLTYYRNILELLIPSPSNYILDGYLSDFLQDRDRSQSYYCDPILQHISICRQFLSLLDGSNDAFDLQS